MKISQKLISIFFLSLVFMIVLSIIYWLIKDRMDYASRANLDISDYRMIARSVKYGLLFVLLTFGVFFMYELLKALRIHPMQYILVGAALSVFYLLLLSFAEKIAFNMAYCLAASACISLISWYLQYVLKNVLDVAYVGGLLVAVYAVMYVLLSLSEYSLMVGSVLLFLLLFAVMYFTRHLDWYQLGDSLENSLGNLRTEQEQDKSAPSCRD